MSQMNRVSRLSRLTRALRDLAALLRPRIGLLAAAGTCAGFVLARPTAAIAPALLCAAAGAFLLSCGASALNQVQERREDAAMVRTQNRPLPTGRLSAAAATLASLCCLGCAGALLAATPGGWTAVLLVPVTVAVYNGLYTPLKKRSSLAMLVGGLAGALPPVLGCVSAGAPPLEPRCLLLAAVFYAWQVPHFWLFARLNKADYAAAGFLTPHNGVGRAGAHGALTLWIVCYGALMLLLPAFGLVAAELTKWLVTALALTLLGAAWPLVARERLGFTLVNASLMLLLVFLAADALRSAA
ncbi:MAG: protoheme IX farnesyltransferase [Proteobacteria bacterium]|nr:protoheme IX farnesyltransferase [Pseudomonadota bacterium]